jgi:hypothetical protein
MRQSPGRPGFIDWVVLDPDIMAEAE